MSGTVFPEVRSPFDFTVTLCFVYEHTLIHVQVRVLYLCYF